MLITLRSQGVGLTSEIRREIERRLEFALDRQRRRLSAVDVFVSDVNGPRGGVDKICQVTAVLRGRRTLTVLERSGNLVAGCGRAGKRLAHRINQTSKPRRGAADPTHGREVRLEPE